MVPVCYQQSMDNPVRQWRERLGLSQERAARRLGITTRNYQNYESGEYAPPESIRMLMRAAILGIELDPWPLNTDSKPKKRRT